ncbi:MAG: hypothetical protein CMA21_03410, partial [Euryarchaeota archaeon]|nr:hypothetical protein [Euryarchaeota archaeon]
MDLDKRKILVALIVSSMLLAGCTAESSVDNDESLEEISETPDTDDGIDPGSAPEEIIEVRGSDYCDDTNQIHCMLPFPSGAFLELDETQITGYSLTIDGQAIPDTQSSVSDNLVILDRLDGFSPSTQIFTAFGEVPDITGMATQFDIGISTVDGHNSVLLNMDTGEKIHHWIELDVRAQDNEETIMFLRTIEGLDHDASYAVGFRDLVNVEGVMIEPADGFRALRDSIETTSEGIENQRSQYENIFEHLENSGFERSTLQSAWWFHTASTESILKDLIILKEDAEERLGGEGIGCNVTRVVEDYGNDGTTLRMIEGTVTTPHYMETTYARTPMMRGDDGDPIFVENREIEFTMVIPKSLADSNSSGPISVFGHGLFGNGKSLASSGRDLANQYNTVALATDFRGWSSVGGDA